jgi:hypothetical protein
LEEKHEFFFSSKTVKFLGGAFDVTQIFTINQNVIRGFDSGFLGYPEPELMGNLVFG